MSAETMGALGRSFFEAQDRLRGGPDPDLCNADYSARIGGNPPMTLTGHQAFASAFCAGFPDLRHTVEETIGENDAVSVRFSLSGTHTGVFIGIPPTGKQIDVGAIAILRIDVGLVTQLTGKFDQFALMKQLGVVS